MAEQRRSDKTSADRFFDTKKLIDRRVDPPIYIDEEVPSTSVVLGNRGNRGLRSPVQGTTESTFYVTGSLREFIPGTYGLRVTRVSLSAGTVGSSTTMRRWYIRHSRDGTYDVIQVPKSGQFNLNGSPMAPLYAFGPGTVAYAWLAASTPGANSSGGSRSQAVEGYVSARRPDQI